MHNRSSCGVDKIPDIKRGDSKKVLPILFNEFDYDLISIDGDNSHYALRTDTPRPLKLLKSDGILCGDDFKIAISEIALEILMSEMGQKVHPAEAIVVGGVYHPGVTVAAG